MSTSTQHFDLIVIGAGPAGSAAAVTARRAGLTVALIDKACFARDKLCGGLVSGRSLNALDQIFGARPSRSDFLISRHVQFSWAGEVLAAFEAPYDLWFTKRTDFDTALFQAALKAGAQDFTGCRWQTLDEAGQISLDTGARLHFRGLIGADGATSPVAAHLFGRAFDPERIGFALEVQCPRTDTRNLMEVDFHAVQWGYGWRFPKHDCLTIGVGGIKAQNPDLRRSLAALLPDDDRSKVKGAFLPFGDFRRKPGRGNILLAGDAAGLVDPLTGEGIAYALESGALAAQVLAEALKAGKPHKAASAYFKALKPLHGELNQANRLRQIAFSPRFEGTFRSKLKTSKTLWQVFFDLLEGKASYKDIEKRIARGVMARLGKGLWPGRDAS